MSPELGASVLVCMGIVFHFLQDGQLLATVSWLLRPLRALNDSIAAFLKTSTWRVLFVEILGFGFTMIQIEEYAVAVLAWVALAVLWTRHISQAEASKRRFGAVGKFFQAVFALLICILLATITNIRRDEKPWSNLEKLAERKSPPVALPPQSVKMDPFFVDIIAPGIGDKRVNFDKTVIPVFMDKNVKPMMTASNVRMWITITNHQSVQSEISMYKVEIKTKVGNWVPLIRIPTYEMSFYSVDKDARKATGWDLAVLDKLLMLHWLTTNETVQGWAFFEYPEGSDGNGFDFIFRVHLRDEAGVEFTSPEIVATKDARNRVNGAELKLNGKTLDLSHAPIQYLGDAPRQDTPKQLAVTQKQADTAQDSAQAIQKETRLDQRAWIRLLFGEVTQAENLPPSVNMAITNTGKTPAKKVNCYAIVEKLPRGTVPNFTSYKDRPANHFMAEVMVPNVPAASYGFQSLRFKPNTMEKEPVKMSAFDIAELSQKTAYGVVHGILTYRDIFDVDHWITFCSYLDTRMTMEKGPYPCDGHNDIDNN
jgi:hypothetical protein